MSPSTSSPWLAHSSSSASAPPQHSSTYPPPPYYHHPNHPGHPPHWPHQQPYYPYHYPPSSPYGLPYPPAHPSHPHPPPHGHTSYHHLHPSHYASRPAMPPPSVQDTVPSSSQPSDFNTKPTSTKPSAAAKTRSGSTVTEASSVVNATSSAKTSTKSSASSAPKTFRFEGSISSESFKTTKSFDLAGVNILNRKPLDTRTALDKLQRRRETHNRVERKRRDCINQLIDDLTKLLPPKHLEEASSKCHRVNVLRGAVSHIKFLSESNDSLSKTLKDIAPDADHSMQVSKTPKDSENADQDMAMDLDQENQEAAVKGEQLDPSKSQEDGEDLDEDKDNLVLDADTRRSTSPSRPESSFSKASPTASPRMTPSRAMGLTPVIVTNAPSPVSEKPGLSALESTLASACPADPYMTESQHHHHRKAHQRTPSSSSLSHSPMFPPAPYSAAAPSAFPPSPISPSLSVRNNPFGPSSPSLPPISSLVNLQIQEGRGATGSGSGPSDPSLLSNEPRSPPRPSHAPILYTYGYYPYHPQTQAIPPASRPPHSTHSRHLSLQPEPIFIQEEPWITQRKRSTSGAPGKSSSASSTKGSSQGSKKTPDLKDAAADTRIDSAPSPTSSLTASPNQRKRTQKPTRDGTEIDSDSFLRSNPGQSLFSIKRVKQDLEMVNTTYGDYEKASRKDGGGGDKKMSKADSGKKETVSLDTKDDQDAAQALTILALNA